ncbi:MAG: acyl carrier protein [Firmicutes bacterium]|nr:acyl carrier protein [Bacillota bacterium]MBQ6663392.1 acyl carrier protein [Bacillota bacterium]
MDQVLAILKNAKPDVDFASEKALIDNNILDSFDIISIVTDLNDTFNVEINIASLLPENFNSAEAIWELVQKLK